MPLDAIRTLYAATGGLDDAADTEDCVDRMVALQLIEKDRERRTALLPTTYYVLRII